MLQCALCCSVLCALFVAASRFLPSCVMETKLKISLFAGDVTVLELGNDFGRAVYTFCGYVLCGGGC